MSLTISIYNIIISYYSTCNNKMSLNLLRTLFSFNEIYRSTPSTFFLAYNLRAYVTLASQ